MHDQVVKNFADALIWQVNNCLVMTLHDATLLIHALKESPYADADIKRITAAIDAKVMMLKSSKAAPDTYQIPWPTSSKHEVLDEPKAEKKGIKRDADSLGIPLMPNESKDGNPAPVQYLGGVIYTRQDRCQFLVVKKNKLFGCEIPWGGGVTKKEAWDECIAAIQAHKQ